MRSLLLLSVIAVALAAARRRERVAAHRPQRARRLARRSTPRARRCSRTTTAARRHVLAWGAVNAIAPTPSRKQVAFELDYAGGWGKYHRDYWKTFGGSCGAYDGPAARLEGGCLQGARRLVLGAAGVAAGAAELRRRAERAARAHGSSGSRTGPARCPCSRSTWTGRGTSSTTSSARSRTAAPASTASARPRAAHPLDTFGRNIYVDTFDSALRRGLEAREQLPHAHRHRGVLLQLQPARLASRGQRRRVPRDGRGPGRDARRDVAGHLARPVQPLGGRRREPGDRGPRRPAVPPELTGRPDPRFGG